MRSWLHKAEMGSRPPRVQSPNRRPAAYADDVSDDGARRHAKRAAL